MKGLRKALLGVCVSAFALGVIPLLVGCDAGSQNTGTQAPVDQAEQEQHNKAMMEYMQNKSATKATPK